MTPTPQANKLRIRAVALPAEHGSWSLVAEPILLGLLVAPSWAGLCLALAAFFAFLAHQPLSIVWGDARRGRRYARTALATRFALGYTAVTLVCAVLAIWLAGWTPLLPFVLALPLMFVFVLYDQRTGRHWQAELAAPVAFAAVSAAIPLAGGWTWPTALALWCVMIARSVPAVLYVRARLRLVKGKPAQVGLALLAQLGGLLGVALLVWWGLLPWTAVVALLILLGRAASGLSRWRRPLSTKALGFVETGLGLLTAVLVAVGFAA